MCVQTRVRVLVCTGASLNHGGLMVPYRNLHPCAVQTNGVGRFVGPMTTAMLQRARLVQGCRHREAPIHSLASPVHSTWGSTDLRGADLNRSVAHGFLPSLTAVVKVHQFETAIKETHKVASLEVVVSEALIVNVVHCCGQALKDETLLVPGCAHYIRKAQTGCSTLQQRTAQARVAERAHDMHVTDGTTP